MHEQIKTKEQLLNENLEKIAFKIINIDNLSEQEEEIRKNYTKEISKILEKMSGEKI